MTRMLPWMSRTVTPAGALVLAVGVVASCSGGGAELWAG